MGNEHRTRVLLMKYINDNPGVTYRMICSTLRTKESTLRYHLKYLLSREQIKFIKTGGEKRFYSFDTNVYRRNQYAKDNGISRNQDRVIRIIEANPGISRTELKGMINTTSKGLSYILSRLKQKKLVWEYEDQGRIRYEVVTREKLIDEMLLVITQKLIDHKIDEQTFLLLKEKIDNDGKTMV